VSFESLPNNLEQGVKQFAKQQHVSHDEAVLMLIETGLQHVSTGNDAADGKNPAQELIGLFSSPEDSALMDEVVSLAYEGRKAAAKRDVAV
jgi:hypothetical protein